MDPINYSQDVQAPFQAAAQGYQFGAAIRNDQLQQQQQQQLIQQQAQQRQALQSLMSKPNPTAEDYANATLIIPGMREQFQQSWNMRNQDQQQNDLQHVSQVYSALTAQQPEVAASILSDRAQALRNSGREQEAKNTDTMAELARANPAFARTMIGMKLAAIPGGDKIVSNVNALDTNDRANALAPGQVREQNAKATTAEVEANNAPTKTYLENVKSGEDIQTAQSQRKIAELDVQIKQANSETDRQKLQLERDKLQFEMNQKQQDSTNAAQDSMDATTTALDTVGRLMTHPGLTSGSGRGGDFNSWFAGTDAADFRNEVETLKSQNFLAEVRKMKDGGPSGLGSLTEAEGAKLESAIARLDPSKQSPQAVMNTLGIIRKGLEKAQSTLVARGKLPTAGGAVIDVPGYGKVSEGQINSLMTRYPGATRDQVMQFLQQVGKNKGGATGHY